MTMLIILFMPNYNIIGQESINCTFFRICRGFNGYKMKFIEPNFIIFEVIEKNINNCLLQ